MPSYPRGPVGHHKLEGDRGEDQRERDAEPVREVLGRDADHDRGGKHDRKQHEHHVIQVVIRDPFDRGDENKPAALAFFLIAFLAFFLGDIGMACRITSTSQHPMSMGA